MFGSDLVSILVLLAAAALGASIALARAFPQARIRGIELSPLPCWISRLRTRNLSDVQLRRAARRGGLVSLAGARGRW